MPRLRYLDRPVFELERSAAEAWGQGGKDAEVAARQAYAKKKQDEHRDQVCGHVCVHVWVGGRGW
jgi:hypothetical protein